MNAPTRRGPRRALAAALACGLAVLACSPVAGLTGAGAPTSASAPTQASAATVAPTPAAPTPAAADTAVARGTGRPRATAAARATQAAGGTEAAGATPAGSATAATNTTPVSNTTPAAGDVTFVAGSSQKVCQLVGETDLQFNKPTANQTETRWGLMGNDLGYSFEHDGKLFFTFGDSGPTRMFNGKPNGPTGPDRSADDNDAIAYTSDTSLNGCPQLTFIHYADGAYKNPVVLAASGQPAITLRTNEVPVAGIDDGGHMYVFFATDNPIYQTGGPSKGDLGSSTRSVVGMSDDDGNTFHYAYDFSKGPGAKFVEVAPAQGSDGFIYFWGSEAGNLYRQSAPFLARKPAGSLGSPDGLEYWHGLNADGTPQFMPGEANATALFHDTDGAGAQAKLADCIGELGLSWSAFLNRWLMLYNCADASPANPRGVYLRTAPQPWGPWSAPQTIFNAQRDGGYCNFIHRAVTSTQPQCDNLSGPNQMGDYGGEYGPYILGRYTHNDAAQGTSTIYYTLSTWIPYTEVIMQTTLQRGQ